MRVPSLGRAVALSVAVALFAGCGDDDGSVTADTGSTILTTSIPADKTTTVPSDESSTTAAPAGTVIELTLSGGEATSGGGRVPIPLDDPVVIRVDADEADELHLHGYDLYLDLVAGETAELRFDATIPGVFELEGHDSGLVVAELEIS